MSENSEIFQRGQPILLVKNSMFLHCLFLFKIGPEIMFGDLLGRKEAFVDNKICILYVQKIGNFPKGLTHDFGQKFQLSSLFVFIKNRSRNDVWGCSR